MPYASHLLNHSRKLRNASKLLHHERAVLVRCFSSDVQSSVNTNRDMWKTRFHGYESSSKNGVSKQSPNFTKRNITMATMERGSISGSLFNRGISRSSQLQSRRCYASASDLPPHQEIGMPSLSPTMTEGNIARWLKKEGDKVSTGEVLCEVETDKATVELECMEEGYLAKIVHGDGSKEIKVGEVIAVTVEDEEDIAKFKDYHPSASESGDSTAKETSSPPPPKKEVDEEPSREPEPKVSKPSEPSSSGDRIFASPLARKLAEEKNVPLSSIKGTGSEGLIVKGDVEDYLGIILSSYLSSRAHYLETIASLLMLENSSVLSLLLALLYTSGVKEVSSPSKAKAATDASLDYTDIPVSQIRKITASRLLLSKQTIPHYYLTVDTCVDKLISLRTHLNSLQEGSGGARISVNDLVIKGQKSFRHPNSQSLPLAVHSPHSFQCCSWIHRVNHQRETAMPPGTGPSSEPNDFGPSNNKQAYASPVMAVNANLTFWLTGILYKGKNSSILKPNLPHLINQIGHLEFLVLLRALHPRILALAAALALRKVPQCNSSWTNDYIRQYHNVNVNVAVQTDHGLFVPVIRDADKKGLSAIGEEVKQLAKKAKENSLKPQDYEGGTFTVSNLGGPFGVKQFCAIINPPQSGILAVGSAEKRVVPGSGTEEFKYASFMAVTLSCDHRVIDGAIGAEWLKAFKGYIENPESMLL
ncbi:hypothetical protein TanjilG_14648 [Lupinus angustifolius]|uniref:Dihydrolipoamide acetyltransferase component of pyruvate dehydrogenase complex n=1 Tax=Lupinus angustifolius TaxID=3871 RepID=A0A1J7HGR9_LUPAN|nr:hypothetical protein TanjilG_14648 [Lupinus angustifolius]